MAKKSIKQRAAPRPKAAAKMAVNVVVVAFGKGGTVCLRKRDAAPLKNRMELPFSPMGTGQTMVKAAQETFKAATGTAPAASALRMVGAYQPSGPALPKNTIWVVYAAPTPSAPADGWTAIGKAKETALAFGHSAMLVDAIQKIHAAAKSAARTGAATPVAEDAQPEAAPAAPAKKSGRRKLPDIMAIGQMKNLSEVEAAMEGFTNPQIRNYMLRHADVVKSDVSRLPRKRLLEDLFYKAKKKHGLRTVELVEEDSVPAAEAAEYIKKKAAAKRLGTGLENMKPQPQAVDKVAYPQAEIVPPPVPTKQTGPVAGENEPKPAPIPGVTPRIGTSLQKILVQQGEDALRAFLNGLSRSKMESATHDQRLAGLTSEQVRAADSDAAAVELIVKATKSTWAQRRAAGS